MIQRVQSLFLAVVVLCGIALAFLYGNPFAEITDITSFLDEIGIACYSLNYFSIVLALISIFKYKNRSHQIRLCFWLIWINILLFASMLYICYVGFLFNKIFSGETGIGLLLFYPLFPFISIISAFLARKYIKKDEELVRSADRIR